MNAAEQTAYATYALAVESLRDESVIAPLRRTWIAARQAALAARA